MVALSSQADSERAQASARIELRVRRPSGEVIKFSCEPTWTVVDVKLAIESAKQIHRADQYLVLGNRQLADAEVLAQLQASFSGVQSSLDLTLVVILDPRFEAEEQDLLQQVELARNHHVLSLHVGYSVLRALPGELGQLISLEELCIIECDSLHTLPVEMGHLPSLRKLHIRACRSLQVLPGELGQLSSLQEFHIIGCNSLKALPGELGQLSSLQELRIIRCDSLKALPGELRQLASLRELHIVECSSLQALPGGPERGCLRAWRGGSWWWLLASRVWISSIVVVCESLRRRLMVTFGF